MKLIVGLLTVFATANAANILAFFTAPSLSIGIHAQQLMLRLSQEGHNITFFTTQPAGLELPRYYEFILPLPQKHRGTVFYLF